MRFYYYDAKKSSEMCYTFVTLELARRMVALRILFLSTFLINIFLANALISQPALAQKAEPDAKSIPKSILMLGLYCNTADTVLKLDFEKNPALTPWRAVDKRQNYFTQFFASLDFNRNGINKAVRDKALTENEAKFLEMTAQKDAANWALRVHEICETEFNHDRLEICLRNLNSEVFKCYQQMNDNVEKLMMSR